MRNHDPNVIDEFFGLWDRGEIEDCPKDHFSRCENADFGNNDVITRTRFIHHLNHNVLLLRMYTYKFAATEQYIYPGNDGCIYMETTAGVISQILSTPNVNNDYDFCTFGELLYIVPSTSYGYNGVNFMLVWDGTTMRTAGGAAPASSATVAQSASAGNIEAGWHYYAVAYETSSGFITPPTITSPVAVLSSGILQVDFTSIPTGPSGTVARRLIATKVIPNPGAGFDASDYETYFIPGGRIADNSTTSLTVNFYDSELLDNASYLFDIFDFPPGGTSICIYHNRIVVTSAQVTPITPMGFIDVNTCIVSRVNDPETFDRVDGILNLENINSILMQLVVNSVAVEFNTGMTDSQEYRNVLYITKLNSTFGVTDNGDVPSTWPISVVDNGNGALRHGITTVLDSGGVNIEYMLIGNEAGLFVFNGMFNRPALSWKIDNIWKNIIIKPVDTVSGDVIIRGNINISLDAINNRIYIQAYIDDPIYGAAKATILFANYENIILDSSAGYQKIKWSKWISATIVPYFIGLRNTDTGVKVFTQDSASQDLWVLDPAGNESVNYIFNTYLLSNEEDDVLHIAGVKYRIVSSGTPDGAFMNIMDEYGVAIDSTQLRQVILNDLTPSTVPTTLFNVKQQRMLLNVEYFGINTIRISKLSFLAKSLYRTIPA